MRDVDRWKPDRGALSKHATTENHAINWQNSKITVQENGYFIRKFLESFHTNKCDSALNDKLIASKLCMKKIKLFLTVILFLVHLFSDVICF